MAEHPPDDIGETIKKFGGPIDQMSIEDIELELEIIKVAIGIFDDAQLDPKLWDDASKSYRQRIRDLETEIFERGVLV